MKNPELYKKTVDILYNAYFNDALQHENCAACAVGNIIAANCDFQYETIMDKWLVWKDAAYYWKLVFTTNNNIQQISPSEYKNEAKFQIDSTGYTWQELAKIEKAFESADRGNNEDDWMYNGLCDVLEVLKQIHEVEDNTKEITKFKQHYLQLIEN